MPLQVTSVEVTPGSQLTAVMDLTHHTPGREGTVLKQQLTLTATRGRSVCELIVDECEGATPDEAMDRMVLWLRRLADGLEQRSPSLALPLL